MYYNLQMENYLIKVIISLINMSQSINFDSNFKAKLSANQVETTLEEDDESFKDLPFIDKTEKEQGKCSKFLMFISLG